MNNTTLKKISEVLGISISTASRALKNHPDISEKTKAKVIELAQTLDYEPNANAIHLRTNNNRLLGIVVPSISNFFYDAFIGAIEEEARQKGYSVMILQSGDNPEVEANNLKLLRQNRVCGVFACITPTTTQMQPFEKITAMQIPVVFFDKVPDYANCIRISIADAEAASMAATALNEAGIKKVLAIFGNPAMSITKKRMQAFTNTIQFPKSCNLLYAHSFNEAYTLTKTHCSHKALPEAVFCMSDEILMGTMKAILELGLQIPKQIKVIALSNGFFPQLYYPNITYIETSGYQLGKLSYHKMMDCINGDRTSTELTVPCSLIKGGSL
jgi:LacI family transcriptional regulator